MLGEVIGRNSGITCLETAKDASPEESHPDIAEKCQTGLDKPFARITGMARLYNRAESTDQSEQTRIVRRRRSEMSRSRLAYVPIHLIS